MLHVAGEPPRLAGHTAELVGGISTMTVWALHWANQGWPVLPCDPEDKSPLIRQGKLGATTDPGQVRAWWTEFPDAMIGGRTDGRVVLDFDAYKDGHLADLQELGELLPTRAHSTPGHDGIRGRHLVFRDPDGACRSTKLGKNRTIDVRAGTSLDYIILPPSVNGHGDVYTVTSWRPPALAPGWLLQARPVAPVNAESHSDSLPAREELPRTLRIIAPDVDDPSEYAYLLARNGLRACLTPGQIRALLEDDPINRSRLAEAKRQQPGWWPQEFYRILQRAQDEVTGAAPQPADDKPVLSQIILQIARRDFEFGQTTERIPFAVPRDGPRIAQVFRGGRSSFRASLSARFEQQFGRAPSNSGLAEAIETLEGNVQNLPPTRLPLRVASHEGELVLDLGTPDGKAVIIGPGAWKVVDQSPVLFTRTDLTAPLPEPVRGGKLNDTLLPMLNLSGPDRDLVVACILSWLWPDIAHPVVYLRGEEGTAKSTAARLLRRLVDPSTVEMRRQPGRDEDFEVTLSGQWGIVLDNLSSISEWLSDAICTAVTGVGDIKRKKYADQELSVLQFRRCFILTSIPPLMERGDLVDRTCAFDLLPVGSRRTDTEIAVDWQRVWPLALGALLDLACKVLSLMPDVAASGIHRGYRLADFALIAASMDQAAGTRAMRCYADKVADSVRSAVEADPFALHLSRLAAEGWEGTAHALFETYSFKLRGPGADLWPKNAISMSKRIQRMTGTLRKSGIGVVHDRSRRGATWRIYKYEQ